MSRWREPGHERHAGPWAFDRHTAVDPATGAAQVTPELGGFLGASGGYVAALALRALRAAVLP